MILLINVISFSRRLSMREYDRHVVSEKDIHSIFKMFCISKYLKYNLINI